MDILGTTSFFKSDTGEYMYRYIFLLVCTEHLKLNVKRINHNGGMKYLN